MSATRRIEGEESEGDSTRGEKEIRRKKDRERIEIVTGGSQVSLSFNPLLLVRANGRWLSAYDRHWASLTLNPRERGRDCQPILLVVFFLMLFLLSPPPPPPTFSPPLTRYIPPVHSKPGHSGSSSVTRRFE